MKFGPEHYRPLIEELTIKESEINGLGLHATEDLKAGLFLGVTHAVSYTHLTLPTKA